MKLADHVLHAFEAHVLDCFPQEACGLVVSDRYLPCKNHAVDPLRDFKIDDEAVLKAKLSGALQAVLHSHPRDPGKLYPWPMEWPSALDMQAWMNDSTPWGIATTAGEGVSPLVWLDEDHPEPLLGRQFVHGINDCYSLVRDAFKELQGITIKNYPRQMDWWNRGGNLYLDNLLDAGFKQVPASEVRVGDALLIKLDSRVISHAAYVSGPDEIMHHARAGKLSCTASLSAYMPKVEKVVRYEARLLEGTN